MHTCRGRETLSGAGAALSDLTLWPSALGQLQADATGLSLVRHRPAEAPSLPSPSQYSPPQASLASRVPSVSPRALMSLSWDPSESRWRELRGMVRMVGRRLGLWGWENGFSTPPRQSAPSPGTMSSFGRRLWERRSCFTWRCRWVVGLGCWMVPTSGPAAAGLAFHEPDSSGVRVMWTCFPDRNSSHGDSRGCLVGTGGC